MGTRLAQRGAGHPADERGSFTLMMAVTVLALFLAVGLVVDGGAKIAAVEQANRSAAEAARAGAQQVDVGRVQGGVGLLLRPGPAQAAATSALVAAGASGSAFASASEVRVQATVTKPTVFLALIGISSVTGQGSATVEVVLPAP